MIREMYYIKMLKLLKQASKGRFFLTRHIQLQLFFVKDIADSVLIIFVPERAKNLGPTHGALFSNFGPEVLEKIVQRDID